MSVNDGFSDEEWGAWGKSDTTAIPQQSQTSNGFGNDDYKKASENNVDKSYKSENRFQDKSGYSGTRGGPSKFTRNEDSDKFRRDTDDDKRTYGNKRNDYSERRNYNNGDRNGDDVRENKGGYRNNRREDCNGYDSKDNQNNYHRNDRNKRDDSTENRGNYRNTRRDDSRENRNRYKNDGFERDDSMGRRNNNRNTRNDNFERDEVRDKNNYRNNERNFDFKRSDSRERNNDRQSRRNDSDDFKEKNDYRNDNRYEAKRGDSRDRPNYRQSKRDDYEPDNKWEKNRNNDRKFETKRDDSWDRNKRDNSREKRSNFRDDRNGDDWDEKRNDSNREFKRNDSNENDFKGRNNDRRGLCGDFERNARIDDEDGFSSRTFVRSKKPSEQGNQSEDIPVSKRATFIPNDDQEDYELHVNCGINFDNYDKIPVEVTGDAPPSSITTFNDLNLPEFLKSNIESLKYAKLTPVQKYAIPIIDADRDLMACAQTGSGKTAAFLIPIIKSLNTSSVETPSSQVAFPKALIMAPTRELCRQIFTAARQLCRGSNVKCAYIYGGIEMNKSRRNIQSSGCDILVATPGRLIHFLELVWISLKYMKFFVLDEADRMLDSEGFYESVNKIYKEADISGDEKTIQISMFSATFPNEIQTLARNLLKNYLFLAVGVVGSANSDVKQEIIQATQKDKITTAIEYIKTIPEEKTLIFVESKRMADFFGIKLGYLGFKATTIHGDREQEQREIALNDFKSGRVNFMVATNVAARGLDIPKVDNVINIDMPSDIDTYVHRIGRTGRCGNVGRAISFFDETKDIGLASGLVNKLEEANQEVADWLKMLCDGSGIRRPNYSRDTRKDVKVSKYMDNPNDDFMKGTNVDYDDAKQSSEWLED